MKQVTKNIVTEKVGGIQDLKAIGGVKCKETRSYQKGNVLSTQTTYRTITFSLLIRPSFHASFLHRNVTMHTLL